MKSLSHLIYNSRIAASDADVLRDEMDDILAASQRNNSALDITGCLIAHSGLFVQVLEGPRDHVLQIYQRILADPRHTEVRLMLMEPLDYRRFPGWAMCVCDPLRLPIAKGLEVGRLHIPDLLDIMQQSIAA